MRALTIAILCFWPPDNSLPPLPGYASSLLGKPLIKSSIEQSLQHSMISRSEIFFERRDFSRFWPRTAFSFFSFCWDSSNLKWGPFHYLFRQPLRRRVSRSARTHSCYSTHVRMHICMYCSLCCLHSFRSYSWYWISQIVQTMNLMEYGLSWTINWFINWK